jgi:hypothetical protein
VRPDTDTADRLAALDRVRTIMGERLDGHLRTAADTLSRRGNERLSLSTEHTVVALVGTTGSGKSSLFNTMAAMPVSAVGLRRPTTAQVHACVWGEPTGAGELLNWLHVPPHLRMARESELDGHDEDDLHGLVLLDLPDFDSTEQSHRVEVDRLVGLVDLLVWVLDPQKYADRVVHERYLRRLAGHEEVTVALLNQVDLLSPADQEACLADLRRLLDADGLAASRLIATSATNSDGLRELRAVLTEAVAARRAAGTRVTADLDQLGEALTGVVGPQAPEEAPRPLVRSLTAKLADAAGVRAIAVAARRDYRRRAVRTTAWPLLWWTSFLRRSPRHGPPDRLGELATPVPADLVDTSLGELADALSEGLPPPWPAGLHRAARERAGELPAAVERAVADGVAPDGVAAPGRSARWWTVVAILHWLLLTVGVAGASWLAVPYVRAVLQLSENAPPLFAGVSVPLLLVVAGIGGGALLALVSRVLVFRAAREHRRLAETGLRDAVRKVVRELVVAPLRAELRAYAETRDALRKLRGAPDG